MRWRRRVQEEEQRRQMAAAAARGVPEIILTAVILRTGCGETEQNREKENRKCAKMYQADLGLYLKILSD